ncbi:hypothetical protein [Rhizobium binae]|uniref:hypothetical protein n=1 Tax=Rhizobium binae TaxID=1138190 RepID=UPI003DA8832D
MFIKTVSTFLLAAAISTHAFGYDLKSGKFPIGMSGSDASKLLSSLARDAAD